MDYSDMAASLRKVKFDEAAVEFRALPNKLHWDPEEIEIKPTQEGLRPRIQEFVDIAKSMTQGSGGIVSLC
jgi:hypothetical protein